MERPPNARSDVRRRPRQEDERPDAELRRARASRDAGLRRVSRLTGWIVAATIVLTGTLSEVAAHALPGHRKRVAPARSTQPQPQPQPQPSGDAVPAPSTDEGDQSSGAPGLQAPEQAPAPSDATGGAVSGGS